MDIQKNVGTIDRVIRIALAIVFAYLYFSGTVTGVLGIILLVLSVIFLVVSLVGVCPLYVPFKISTRKKE